MRDEIDKLLIEGRSYRDISGQYGITKSSLERHHKNDHIPALLASSHKAEEEAKGDTILQEVKELKIRALSILAKAEKSGDLKTALAGIKETRSCLELMARVLGEIQGQGINVNVSVNILQSQEWILVRSALMESLQPFPEARAAASNALLRIDNRGRNAGR